MHDELFARLKRLRRDLDPPKLDPKPARDALPDWFKRRLARPGLDAELVAGLGTNPARGAELPNEASVRVKSLAAPRALAAVSNAFGSHAERIARLPFDERHG